MVKKLCNFLFLDIIINLWTKHERLKQFRIRNQLCCISILRFYHNFCSKRTWWPSTGAWVLFTRVTTIKHSVAKADIIVGHSNQDNDALATEMVDTEAAQEEHLVDTRARWRWPWQRWGPSSFSSVQSGAWQW